MTATTFKERYANHTSSFRHKKDSNKTELSKHIWKLKENNQDYTIKWSILKHAISYTGGSKRCNLCLEEKFCILKDINKDNICFLFYLKIPQQSVSSVYIAHIVGVDLSIHCKSCVVSNNDALQKHWGFDSVD